MAAITVLACGRCTVTPATSARLSAKYWAAVLAVVALRCHSEGPNIALSWGVRKRGLDASWGGYLMVGASTCWGTRLESTTTASAPSAPLLVAPSERLSTPSAVGAR